jgi:hypothetical protein
MVMKALGKLSGFAAVAGLTAMLTVPVVPAQAQISPEGSNALLGAGIGAIAGGVLGHGNIGPVLGGAAAGAVVGALATPHQGYYYNNGYGYPYGYPRYSYGYGSSYYPYSSYSYRPYGYTSYPYSSYGYSYYPGYGY